MSERSRDHGVSGLSGLGVGPPKTNTSPLGNFRAGLVPCILRLSHRNASKPFGCTLRLTARHIAATHHSVGPIARENTTKEAARRRSAVEENSALGKRIVILAFPFIFECLATILNDLEKLAPAGPEQCLVWARGGGEV